MPLCTRTKNSKQRAAAFCHGRTRSCACPPCWRSADLSAHDAQLQPVCLSRSYTWDRGRAAAADSCRAGVIVRARLTLSRSHPQGHEAKQAAAEAKQAAEVKLQATADAAAAADAAEVAAAGAAGTDADKVDKAAAQAAARPADAEAEDAEEGEEGDRQAAAGAADLQRLQQLDAMTVCTRWFLGFCLSAAPAFPCCVLTSAITHLLL